MNYDYGMRPADVAAVTGNNGGLFGGNDSWLAALFLLPLFAGGWGGGFGGFGGGIGALLPWLFLGGGGFGGWGGNCGGNCATQADLAAGFNNSAVLNKLNDLTLGQAGIQQTMCQGFNGINTSILEGFHGVDNAVCTLGYQTQQGFNGVERSMAAMAAEQAKCCCESQRLTERGFADTNYNMATQFCETRHQASDNTRDLIENQNCNARAILDAIRKVGDDAKDARLAEQDRTIFHLQLRESQANQNNVFRAALDASTAEIIRRTGNECPVPAYVVPNPNCCYGNPVGVGYGNCGNSCNGGFGNAYGF